MSNTSADGFFARYGFDLAVVPGWWGSNLWDAVRTAKGTRDLTTTQEPTYASIIRGHPRQERQD